MADKDTYLSVGGCSESVFRDNGSRFLAFVHPVETVQEAMDIVADYKKKYHDARHHCYAYRIGSDGEVWRANDDGEPSGSAARPILGQIDSAGVSDVLVVVVRYFGGIKLGIPGLIRAYKTSAQEALAAAGTVEKIASRWFRLEFSYDNMPAVMKVVKDLTLDQRNRNFDLNCALEVKVRLGNVADFLEGIEKICNFNEIK